MTNDQYYEQHIRPLVDRIKELCHARNVPFIASFVLGSEDENSCDMLTTANTLDGPLAFQIAAQTLLMDEAEFSQHIDFLVVGQEQEHLNN